MYKYILVDDEPLIRMGTKKKLEPMADQIQCIGEADNGEQAIALAEQLHPDVVILDMEMPVMDGTKLLPYLAEHYPETQLIVISGYKSFDYVKHALSANVIDYILKPFTAGQIQDTVRQALERIETSNSIHAQIRLSEEQKEIAYYEHDVQLIQNLILGYSVSDTEIGSQKLAFLRQSQKLVLAMVYISMPVEQLHISEHLSELEFSEMTLFLPHPSNPHIGFFILCLPNDMNYPPSLFYTKALQNFISYMQTYHALSYWGISSSCSGHEHLHTAYEQACASLSSMPVNQTQSQYYIWEPEIESRLHEFHWEKKEEFLFRIEAGMSTDVHRLLSELYTQELQIESLTLADIKYHYHQLTEECLLILKQYLNQSGASQSMHNIVKEIFSVEELHKYYDRFFCNLSEMLKPKSVYAIEDTIEQIKIYTCRNYYKNLTVDFLASLFYMNSSYLSHLFRKQTGEKYVQYLNSIRIEKAKELLTTTDKKLYQIAKAVGYDNNKYFFRVFKKWEGITPEQYRSGKLDNPLFPDE